ncbi:MAG: hypothetical protein ACKO1I_19425 [Microcystis aeruginosa]
MSPNSDQVISLDPEFITPQDGQEKQDCEVSAAKRWIKRHTDLFSQGAVTLLGDDLYSRFRRKDYTENNQQIST